MNRRRKVLIAGSSSGIGKATAVRFATEGCDVCLTARREKELLAIVDGLPAGDHLVCAGDSADPATTEAIASLVRDRWDRLDVLVNSVGVWLAGDAIDTPMGQWRQPLDTLVNVAVNLTRTAVPLMIDGGRIIHITSIHGERGEADVSSYSMAKAAINQYCRALAVELAPRGILVNAIAPGFIETPMSMMDGVSELETDWFRKYYQEGHLLPLKRAGQPEEVAGVAWFLAGPDATYITGQVLTVDGGLTTTF